MLSLNMGILSLKIIIMGVNDPLYLNVYSSSSPVREILLDLESALDSERAQDFVHFGSSVAPYGFMTVKHKFC